MSTASITIKSSSDKSSKSQTNIGVFDSGVGGLSIVNALQTILPNEEIAYFADQANFPYGEKSPEQILSYSRSAATFLVAKGIKLLAIACHTASAYALETLQQELSVPVLGMIEPTLELLQGNKRLGLLGSKALIGSNLYQERILAEKPGIITTAIACQDLVTVVEEKKIATPEARQIAEKLLHGHQFDEILLVCTHFAFIKGLLQDVVGPEVKILDPAEAMAKAIEIELGKAALQNEDEGSKGYQFYTSKI